MKQHTRVALAAMIMAAPTLSMAANIEFKGKVNDQTCTVDVGGQPDATVILPTVSTTQLATAGATTGMTPFMVNVSGCKADAAGVAVNMVFSGAPITSNGNLQNTQATNAAGNVELQLLRDGGTTGSGSVINLTSVTTIANALNIAPGATSASHEFAVRYYASGASTPGDVQAVVNYDITYP